MSAKRLQKMNEPIPPKPKYLWPRFVLAAFLLGVCLAVLAIRKEADRIQRMRGNGGAIQITNSAPMPRN
jgi:hypothetical protein